MVADEACVILSLASYVASTGATAFLIALYVWTNERMDKQ